MLSAISATLLAIRPAMIAYAEDGPLLDASPATEAALFAMGFGTWPGFLTTVPGAAFLTGARAAGFFGTPFI